MWYEGRNIQVCVIWIPSTDINASKWECFFLAFLTGAEPWYDHGFQRPVKTCSTASSLAHFWNKNVLVCFLKTLEYYNASAVCAPRGKLWPRGAKLSPRGEVIPRGWNSPFAPTFFKTLQSVHPGGWTKGWTFSLGDKFHPWGPSSPLGTHHEPILRLLNLQLQRQRCSRLERFF
jgi:hypothetical protein